jgi:hypothetical protein
VRPWSDFYSKVLPWAPGAFEGSVDDALRQAAIDFCEKTEGWQRTLDATSTSAGTAAYDLELDGGEAVVRLLNLKVGGKTANFIAAAQADDWPDDEERTDLVGYTTDRATLVLDPVPAVSGLPIVARVALKPTQDADGVDDALFQQYAQGISFGAITLLCSQLNKPYSNPQQAVTAAGAFESAKQEARNTVATGGARIRLRVKPY